MFAPRNEEGHYTWAGVKHPSVTTVIGMAASEPLMMWYAKTAAQEAADRISRDDIQGAMDWASVMRAPINYRDYKGNVGTVVHHALYERILGLSVPADLQGYAMAIAQRLALGREGDETGYLETLGRDAAKLIQAGVNWLAKVKPEFHQTGLEAVVVNQKHSYAGTADGFATIGGKMVLLDWKTSNSLWEDKVYMQLEAYANAEFIGSLDDGKEFDLPRVEALKALHVTPDGVREVDFPRSEEVFEQFLALRDYYGAANNMPRPDRPLRRAKPAPRSGPKECPF